MTTALLARLRGEKSRVGAAPARSSRLTIRPPVGDLKNVVGGRRPACHAVDRAGRVGPVEESGRLHLADAVGAGVEADELVEPIGVRGRRDRDTADEDRVTVGVEQLDGDALEARLARLVGIVAVLIEVNVPGSTDTGHGHSPKRIASRRRRRPKRC